LCPLHIWGGERNTHSASIQGALNTICKQQSCHKLGIDNGNITALKEKMHELTEKGNHIPQILFGITST